MDDVTSAILWSNYGFDLHVFKEELGGYRFEFTNNGQGSPMIIAAWVQEELENPKNISVTVSSTNYEDLTVEVIWNSANVVYRDTVSSNEGFQGSNVVLQVEFVISILHVIWSYGLILVGEEILDNLHIFNSTSLRRLGYVTLQQNSINSLKFDNHTATIWLLVRKYDELTKSRTSHLNCYRLPQFQLFSSFPMPRGFSSYYFVKLQERAQKGTQITFNLTTTVLCTNELTSNYQLLYFVGPKRPYYIQEFKSYDSLLQIVQLPLSTTKYPRLEPINSPTTQNEVESLTDRESSKNPPKKEE